MVQPVQHIFQDPVLHPHNCAPRLICTLLIFIPWCVRNQHGIPDGSNLESERCLHALDPPNPRMLARDRQT